MSTPDTKPQDLWAILELFGHARIAGRISEQEFAGGKLVRVDVPEVTAVRTTWRNGADVAEPYTIPAHTRSLGMAAVYSINWCDEATARMAAETIKHQPINPFSGARALANLPASELQRLLGPAREGGSVLEEEVPY